MPFQHILGQNQALTIIKQSIKNARLAHAYLFYGPSSVGKKQTAIELAKSINCNKKGPLDNCGNCISCSKIKQDIHPDIFLLEPNKSTPNAKEAIIRVDTIRKLQKKLSYHPYEGKTKVVIINDAEKMNLQAANTFLKTLEEPPSHTMIILVTSNLFHLLPTIISRCQGVKFNLLPVETLIGILSENKDIVPEEVELRSWRAGGSLERASSEDLLESSHFRKDLLLLLENATFDRIDIMFQWSKSWSKKPNQLQDLLEELMLILRDLSIINCKCNAKYIINQDLISIFRNLAISKKLSTWIKMFQAVSQTCQALRRNQNTQLSLDIMLIKFCEAT